ncbi:hypothetical protein BpHYR1_018582 [Brachionus plicatilis]|uniref:Uncharacterized protein n=1 Tax=Brachionus plicatilis TaxID=10195 RepID=A0A3M7QJJ3_BRAPC|nr:hypothetical protein BpHYR1_018582 [Brachionus plicatilis]
MSMNSFNLIKPSEPESIILKAEIRSSSVVLNDPKKYLLKIQKLSSSSINCCINAVHENLSSQTLINTVARIFGK